MKNAKVGQIYLISESHNDVGQCFAGELVRITRVEKNHVNMESLDGQREVLSVREPSFSDNYTLQKMVINPDDLAETYTIANGTKFHPPSQGYNGETVDGRPTINLYLSKDGKGGLQYDMITGKLSSDLIPNVSPSTHIVDSYGKFKLVEPVDIPSKKYSWRDFKKDRKYVVKSIRDQRYFNVGDVLKVRNVGSFEVLIILPNKKELYLSYHYINSIGIDLFEVPDFKKGQKFKSNVNILGIREGDVLEVDRTYYDSVRCKVTMNKYTTWYNIRFKDIMNFDVEPFEHQMSSEPAEYVEVDKLSPELTKAMGWSPDDIRVGDCLKISSGDYAIVQKITDKHYNIYNLNVYTPQHDRIEKNITRTLFSKDGKSIVFNAGGKQMYVVKEENEFLKGRSVKNKTALKDTSSSECVITDAGEYFNTHRRIVNFKKISTRCSIVKCSNGDMYGRFTGRKDPLGSDKYSIVRKVRPDEFEITVGEEYVTEQGQYIIVKGYENTLDGKYFKIDVLDGDSTLECNIVVKLYDEFLDLIDVKGRKGSYGKIQSMVGHNTYEKHWSDRRWHTVNYEEPSTASFPNKEELIRWSRWSTLNTEEAAAILTNRQLKSTPTSNEEKPMAKITPITAALMQSDKFTLISVIGRDDPLLIRTSDLPSKIEFYGDQVVAADRIFSGIRVIPKASYPNLHGKPIVVHTYLTESKTKARRGKIFLQFEKEFKNNSKKMSDGLDPVETMLKEAGYNPVKKSNYYNPMGWLGRNNGVKGKLKRLAMAAALAVGAYNSHHMVTDHVNTNSIQSFMSEVIPASMQ